MVPGLDDPFLRRVDVSFVLDVAHADAHAVLAKHDVFLAHLCASLLANVLRRDPDVVGDKSDAADYNEEDYEGQEGAM